MDVYAVLTTWRESASDGSYLQIYKTRGSAKECFDEEVANLLGDYGLDENDERLTIEEDSAEFVTGDYDYFSVNILKKHLYD